MQSLWQAREGSPRAQLKGQPLLPPKHGAGVTSCLHVWNRISPFHLKRNQYNPDKARLRAPSSPECPQCHLEWELHPPGWVAPEPCTDILLPPHPSSPHPNSLLIHPPLPPQGWRTKRVFAGSRGLSFFLSFSPWKPGYYSSSL